MTQRLEALVSRVLLSCLYLIARLGLESLYIISPALACAAIKAHRRIFSASTNMSAIARAISRSPRLRRLDLHIRHLAFTVYVPVELRISAGDYAQASLYFEGYPPFLSELLSFADAETLFFDIGANVGFFSIALSKKVSPSLIHAFEPVPSTFARLRENLTENCPGAHAHQIAISSGAGNVWLSVPEIDSGSASMHFGEKDTVELHEQSVRCRRDQVQTIAFDDFWVSEIEAKRLSTGKIILKIDVEGHELKVLDGMQKFLTTRGIAALIAIEVRHKNLSAVDEAMTNHGFSVIRPFYMDSSAVKQPQHHYDLLYGNIRKY